MRWVGLVLCLSTALFLPAPASADERALAIIVHPALSLVFTLGYVDHIYLYR